MAQHRKKHHIALKNVTFLKHLTQKAKKQISIFFNFTIFYFSFAFVLIHTSKSHIFPKAP